MKKRELTPAETVAALSMMSHEEMEKMQKRTEGVSLAEAAEAAVAVGAIDVIEQITDGTATYASIFNAVIRVTHPPKEDADTMRLIERLYPVRWNGEWYEDVPKP